MKQLTEKKAIEFFDSKKLAAMSFRERAEFQIFQDRLCMPFSVFHEAVEKTLKRPVFTHEFGLNRDGLKKELLGEAGRPTLTEIINLIPEEKKVIVVCKGGE